MASTLTMDFERYCPEAEDFCGRAAYDRSFQVSRELLRLLCSDAPFKLRQGKCIPHLLRLDDKAVLSLAVLSRFSEQLDKGVVPWIDDEIQEKTEEDLPSEDELPVTGNLSAVLADRPMTLLPRDEVEIGEDDDDLSSYDSFSWHCAVWYDYRAPFLLYTWDRDHGLEGCPTSGDINWNLNTAVLAMSAADRARILKSAVEQSKHWEAIYTACRKYYFTCLGDGHSTEQGEKKKISYDCSNYQEMLATVRENWKAYLDLVIPMINEIRALIGRLLESVPQGVSITPSLGGDSGVQGYVGALKAIKDPRYEINWTKYHPGDRSSYGRGTHEIYRIIPDSQALNKIRGWEESQEEFDARKGYDAFEED